MNAEKEPTLFDRLAEPFPAAEVKGGRRSAPAMTRFWRRVRKRPGGCWEFSGSAVSPKGHRKFVVATGRQVLAHRYSWGLKFGDPGPLCVLHRCDNPACVRPDHLFLGTRADNNADMDAKGRRRPHVGENNPLAKLTEDDVRAIRVAHAGGKKLRQIAADFGVSYTTVSTAAHRKTWRHVT